MKVALIHDYLREYGGAERVVEALHEVYSEAPLYVGFYDPKALGGNAQRFSGWDIRQTVLAKFPLIHQLYSPYRAFAAWAFGQLDLSGFDVIVSSTNMYMAKGVRFNPDAVHLSYIHTPSRSLYGLTTRTDWKKNGLIRVLGETINIWMRYWDYQTAQLPTQLIANSQTTQERIKKYYRRDSVIIPPPVAFVDRTLAVLPKKNREYALYVNRLVFSKHPELALQAALEANIPLKIAGTGPMLERLREQAAGKNVEFLGSVSDGELAKLYQGARVLLYPAEDEDFGMVPIEAMSAGTPVIAHYSGEPRFTVVDGKTGRHVSNLELHDWSQVLKEAWETDWDYQSIQKSVAKFSQAGFAKRMTELVAEVRKKKILAC